MEFLELLEKIQRFIPIEYAGISQAIDTVYPYLYLIISAVICFFGLKVHHIWLKVFLFGIGFFIGALSGVLFPQNWSIYIFVALGVALGLVLAALSNKFHKLQLFTVNFLMVLSAFNAILMPILNYGIARIIAFVFAILAGIIAMRFKYIVTIISSSWMGAVQTTAALLHLLNYQNWVISAGASIVLAAAGMGLQFWQEKKHDEKHKAKHETPAQQIATD